jgi:hypothetical protein
VAGFGAAVLALIGGNTTVLLDALEGPPRLVVGVALVAAAFSLATAVAVAIWGALRPKAHAVISAEETSHYTSRRFVNEPELWRVHLRSLRALDYATTNAQAAGDSAATAVERSLKAFLLGLGFSLLAIATLVAEVI